MFGFTPATTLSQLEKEKKQLLEEKGNMHENFKRAQENAEYNHKREIARLNDSHKDALLAKGKELDEARYAYETETDRLKDKHSTEIAKIERESEAKIATLELKIERIEEAYKAQFEEASRQYEVRLKNIKDEADAKVAIEKAKVEAEKEKIIADGRSKAFDAKATMLSNITDTYEEKYEELSDMYKSIIETLTDIIGERTDIDVVELIKNLPQPVAKANATSTSTKK